MELKMLNDYIGVTPVVGSEKTSSGIIVPVNYSKMKTEHGVVRFVGKECKGDLKEGDEVVYDKAFAVEIMAGAHEEEKVFVLKEQNVYAYIRRKEGEIV